MAGRITYLNTDLDLFSGEDLTALGEALESGGMLVHYVGKNPEGGYRAHFDPGVLSHEPEEAMAAMLDIIERLDGSAKAAWDKCTRREFNIGYNSGDEPRVLEQRLSTGLLGRLVALGGGVAITIYEPDPEASRA